MLIIDSSEKMQLFGERLAPLLPSGTILALHGELGTGKTTFVQGACRAFGVGTERDSSVEPQEVASPTFVIMRQYTGTDAELLVHIDAYRLEGPEELWDIGSDDIFAEARLSFVEWPERVEEALLRPYLRLELEHTENGRSVSFARVGEFDKEIYSRVQDLFDSFEEQAR